MPDLTLAHESDRSSVAALCKELHSHAKSGRIRALAISYYLDDEVHYAIVGTKIGFDLLGGVSKLFSRLSSST